jgi:hypothetical protein
MLSCALGISTTTFPAIMPTFTFLFIEMEILTALETDRVNDRCKRVRTSLHVYAAPTIHIAKGLFFERMSV